MSNPIVSHLTAANGRKYGINRAEQYDFTDDGNAFRGFIYKGMPITQHYSHGEVYLTIRTDYLTNNYTWREWRDTPEYMLEDEFNHGGSHINLDKLVSNLESIIAKRELLNELAKFTEDQEKAVRAEIQRELTSIENTLAASKSNIEWYRCSKYQLADIIYNIDYLEKAIERGNHLLEHFNEQSLQYKKELYEKITDGSLNLLNYLYSTRSLEQFIKS